jgi:hypothetical protein
MESEMAYKESYSAIEENINKQQTPHSAIEEQKVP